MRWRSVKIYLEQCCHGAHSIILGNKLAYATNGQPAKYSLFSIFNYRLGKHPSVPWQHFSILACIYETLWKIHFPRFCLIGVAFLYVLLHIWGYSVGSSTIFNNSCFYILIKIALSIMCPYFTSITYLLRSSSAFVLLIIYIYITILFENFSLEVDLKFNICLFLVSLCFYELLQLSRVKWIHLGVESAFIFFFLFSPLICGTHFLLL